MVIGPLDENSLGLLNLAIQCWIKRGLRFVNLPWIVPTQYSAITRPADRADIHTPHGVFVGSAEQSFVQYWEQGKLPAGAPGFIGWTPCLRDEPVLDSLHHFSFIKVELFFELPARADARDVSHELSWVLTQQEAVFEAIARKAGYEHVPLLRERVSADQIDLTLNGIEIGSYGVRALDRGRYIYGTALALPRFTQALTKNVAREFYLT